MQALAFWKAVTMDRTDFLERIINLLQEAKVRFCVVGGVAVNAYAEPVVTIDLDIAVAAEDFSRVKELLRQKLEAGGSNLRVQLMKDPRYFDFVERAKERDVLGLTLPVAAIEDLLRAKVWAFQDPQRRGSKRQKDLTDIARLLETRPDLSNLVPAD